MKQPEELSAYKESVLQDIAQAQRVGADENAITALISQYPLDQALAAARADVFRDMESAVPGEFQSGRHRRGRSARPAETRQGA